MLGHPRKGDIHDQAHLAVVFADQILSANAHVSTPAASSDHALLTQETTRLEPGTLDHKLYVRGVGAVREQSIKGPSERLTLVSVSRNR